MYYVNDGVYGSFNCLVFDHATVEPCVLEKKSAKIYSSSIWGPSCDSMDCITKCTPLPEVSLYFAFVFHNYFKSRFNTQEGWLNEDLT